MGVINLGKITRFILTFLTTSVRQEMSTQLDLVLMEND